MDTVWVTKWALSGGVMEMRAERASDNPASDDPLYVPVASGYRGPMNLRRGREVFESVDDALANAEDRRKAKIASLRKQIEKLERLAIKVKPLSKD